MVSFFARAADASKKLRIFIISLSNPVLCFARDKMDAPFYIVDLSRQSGACSSYLIRQVSFVVNRRAFVAQDFRKRDRK